MTNMDNDIATVLGEAGLNASEITVYTAGIKGHHTSAELLQATGLPRPTLMAALKELRNYGLCVTHQRDGRSLVYAMKSATALKGHLGQKVRELNDVMDRLDSVRMHGPELSLQEVSGQAAVQELLELALYCKSRKWQIIAPRTNALYYMPKTYTEYFKKVRKEREIQSESLWEEDRKGEQLPLRDILMRKPRFVPKDIGKNIPSLMLAFDDCLLIIDGTTNPTAVLLQSDTVAKTFAIIFEMAWRNRQNG